MTSFAFLASAECWMVLFPFTVTPFSVIPLLYTISSSRDLHAWWTFGPSTTELSTELWLRNRYRLLLENANTRACTKVSVKTYTAAVWSTRGILQMSLLKILGLYFWRQVKFPQVAAFRSECLTLRWPESLQLDSQELGEISVSLLWGMWGTVSVSATDVWDLARLPLR